MDKHMQGKSFSETGRELEISHCTVSRFIKRYNKTGKTDHVCSKNKTMPDSIKLRWSETKKI